MFGTRRLAKYVQHAKSMTTRTITSGRVNQTVNIHNRAESLDKLAGLGVSGHAISQRLSNINLRVLLTKTSIRQFLFEIP